MEGNPQDEEENRVQIEKEEEVDGTPNTGVPPSDLRLSQQDEMSALSGQCYTPKHLQKDHAMVATSNPYNMLGDESDDEDEETYNEVSAV